MPLPLLPLGHGSSKKTLKSALIRLKWSARMEKTFATYHFSIILISLKVGVVLISYFLVHASILWP